MRRCLFLPAVAQMLWPAASWGQEAVLPDAANPDYLLCEDFEPGGTRPSKLPDFAIARRHGVREGAGCKSRYGYTNVIHENYGIPPYPTVGFPKQEGTIFVHYHLQCPANFYLGRANHGYYLYDSKERGRGSVVMDHATDHPAWLDPEWDPHTVNVLRGSGYGRIVRSFEGFEPKRRGEWRSHQVMIIPSNKDPQAGRMKVWIDGELANFCKHDTIPRYDTFWVSNYWHSLEYVPKDTLSNLFESFTAPPHPAFEIFLDNLIVSKSFIEFGPNRFQIERLRFSDLRPDCFTVNFDTTVAARKLRAEWIEAHAKTPAGRAEDEAKAPGYFHALKLRNLLPGKTYSLVLAATDEKGREVKSPPVAFTTRAGSIPEFHLGEGGTVDGKGDPGGWKGEVFSGHGFQGTPVYVRSFYSLSYVAWPGPGSDDLIDTSEPMCVRTTKRARFAAGTYVFRVQAYDGVRVLADGIEKLADVRRTQGHNFRKDFRIPLAEGEHTVVVEHTLWRDKGWEAPYSKHLAFKITPDDTEPPKLYAHAIYNTRFHKPEEPTYCGRWSEEVEATVEFGETDKYGQSAKGRGRCPTIKLGRLDLGKTYHWRVTAVDLMGNQTVTPDAVFTCGDTLPPEKILLAAERASDTQIRLLFRAPGEDGRHGQAVAYDLRWSTEPLNGVTWGKATQVKNVSQPQPARSEERITLDGFPRGRTYYIAIRATDRAGQAGLLSNVVSDPPGPEVMDCDGDGYGVGSLKGPDPDDYDPSVPAAAGKGRR